MEKLDKSLYNKSLEAPHTGPFFGVSSSSGGSSGVLQNAPIWGKDGDQTIETFATHVASSNTGNWSHETYQGNSTGYSTNSINVNNDYHRMNKNRQGGHWASVFSIPADVMPDSQDFTLRFKHWGSHPYAASGSNPYDASYSLFIRNADQSDRIGFYWEHVPHQGYGVKAYVKSSSGSTSISPTGITPTSGTFYFEMIKADNSYTLNIYTTSDYSGTPTYTKNITNTNVSNLEGLDRMVITDHSYTNHGAWTTQFDDFELIVVM